jgi:hypothetical protein
LELPDKDRREVAKRIFDALCVKYPEKYIALVQPGEPVAPTPSEAYYVVANSKEFASVAHKVAASV